MRGNEKRSGWECCFVRVFISTDRVFFGNLGTGGRVDDSFYRRRRGGLCLFSTQRGTPDERDGTERRKTGGRTTTLKASKGGVRLPDDLHCLFMSSITENGLTTCARRTARCV